MQPSGDIFEKLLNAEQDYKRCPTAAMTQHEYGTVSIKMKVFRVVAPEQKHEIFSIPLCPVLG